MWPRIGSGPTPYSGRYGPLKVIRELGVFLPFYSLDGIRMCCADAKMAHMRSNVLTSTKMVINVQDTCRRLLESKTGQRLLLAPSGAPRKQN
jgi:hypothetical protein